MSASDRQQVDDVGITSSGRANITSDQQAGVTSLRSSEGKSRHIKGGIDQKDGVGIAIRIESPSPTGN
jgi:hypothetical protein